MAFKSDGEKRAYNLLLLFKYEICQDENINFTWNELTFATKHQVICYISFKGFIRNKKKKRNSRFFEKEKFSIVENKS